MMMPMKAPRDVQIQRHEHEKWNEITTLMANSGNNNQNAFYSFPFAVSHTQTVCESHTHTFSKSHTNVIQTDFRFMLSVSFTIKQCRFDGAKWHSMPYKIIQYEERKSCSRFVWLERPKKGVNAIPIAEQFSKYIIFERERGREKKGHSKTSRRQEF